MPLTTKNHYVPQLYLKHFSSHDGYLYSYRTLVSRNDVRPWKRVSPGGVGYLSHLYTRNLATGLSDEIELWLNKKFETPVVPSLEKVVRNERLQAEDYRLLVRFVASQVVRTPAFLIRNLPRWRDEAQKQADAAPDFVRRELTRLKESGERSTPEHFPNAEYLPIRLTRVSSLKEESLRVRTEVVVGRAYWMFAIRQILTSTLSKLEKHRWVILSADEDIPWFTTDDPVVRLNYRQPWDYDFGGGWNVPKTNILLPLSPRHLFFTQVGGCDFQRHEVLPRDLALTLRRMIAEHAHRYIFSSEQDSSVLTYRPRRVNPEAVISEREEWRRWHEDQSAAESTIFKPADTCD